MDQTLVFGLAAILVLGGLLFIAISKITNKRCTKHFNVEKYQERCLANEQRLKSDNPATFHLCVLEGDKLVDQALRECGVNGETMAERMKSASNRFSDLNGLWTAHKLRNRIAHEADARVSYDEARYALSCFRKALKDLGAI